MLHIMEAEWYNLDLTTSYFPLLAARYNRSVDLLGNNSPALWGLLFIAVNLLTSPGHARARKSAYARTRTLLQIVSSY